MDFRSHARSSLMIPAIVDFAGDVDGARGIGVVLMDYNMQKPLNDGGHFYTDSSCSSLCT